MIIAAKGTVATSGTNLAYRWVAVGNAGVLITSDTTNASSWTTRTSSFGTTNITSVASDGLGLYVAVGDTGKIATSPDGITWTQRTSGTTSNFTDVAYGNGYWVAVGAAYRYSTDGITWTTFTPTTLSGTSISVGYGNGRWLILGASLSTASTATNPAGTWTAATTTITAGGDVTYAVSQAVWVAGIDAGTTGALASSTDGTTWTARTSANTANNNAVAFASNSSIIVAQQGYSTTNQIQTTTDGITWTNRTSPTTSRQVGVAADAQGNFISVGSTTNSPFTTSSNGTTWSSVSGSWSLNAICHSTNTH